MRPKTNWPIQDILAVTHLEIFGKTIFSWGFWGRSPKSHNSEHWKLNSSYKHVWVAWVEGICDEKCTYYVLINCIWHCVRGEFIQNCFQIFKIFLIGVRTWDLLPADQWQNTCECFLLSVFQSFLLLYTNYFYHIVWVLIMSFISMQSILVVVVVVAFSMFVLMTLPLPYFILLS